VYRDLIGFWIFLNRQVDLAVNFGEVGTLDWHFVPVGNE
jgi:hypothetical protein